MSTRRGWHTHWWLGLAMMAMIPLAATVRAAEERPNVLLIVVDTLRADHMNLDDIISFPRDTVPNLNALSKEATVFSKVASASSWTFPSYTSLLTGMHAFHHNHNVATNLMDETSREMLTQCFRNVGYRMISIQTNAFVLPMAAPIFDEEFSFLEGEQSNAALDMEQSIDRSATRMAAKWLDNYDGDSSAPFFMFVGLFGPHWPYAFKNNDYLEEFVGDTLYNLQEVITFTPHAYGGIQIGDLSDSVSQIVGVPKGENHSYTDSRLYFAAYDAEIKNTDEKIGNVIAKLKEKGLYDNTIIVVTADHGEHMADHTPFFSHGTELFIGALHVPMIIKFANQTSSQHISDWVRTIDLLPTLMDTLGVASVDDEGNTITTDGKSLMPAVRGYAIDYDKRPVLSYTVDGETGEKKTSIITQEGYHLIAGEENYKLFDINTDFLETTEISETNADLAAELNDAIAGYLESSSP